MDFSQIILNEKQSTKTDDFQGTFLEYLHIVKDNNDIPKLAHERIYKKLIEEGMECIKTEEDIRLRRIYGQDIIKRYGVFEDKFFGIDKTLMKIVRYFYTAAMGGEEARQVLYLVGPVGAGKSSLIDLIKALLEQSEHIYTLEGCPMNEEPLHLIPKASRKTFEEALDVKIEGDLCPICKYRLENEFNGDYEKFPVVKKHFSIKDRQGIGVVPPVDPNNQDTSVLVGSVDISKMDLYAEDDPRVFALNGAFNIANRGLIEFIEVFKNDIEYLYTMLTATQEKLIPSPAKGSMIHFDGVILAHSNETEWNKFRSDHTNEAILDRIVKIEVPYCLELDEEVKIYKKLLKRSKFTHHIAPHTLEIAAMFAILTRLKPSNKVDNITKLRIYNGEDIIEKGTTKRTDIMELKDEFEREGMSGISTRFIMKVIDTGLAECEDGCLNPIILIEMLINGVKELSLNDETKKAYLTLIQDTIKKEYHKILEAEVTRAFIHGYKEQAEDMFNNYLDHAEAYINKTKVKHSDTYPDENFLRSIEEQLGITPSGAKGFRQDVTAYMFTLVRSGQEITYSCYEPLKEAIEKRLTSSVRELTRVITVNKIRNNDQNHKYDAMTQEMKQNGYCDTCCNVVLKYAANNLWKD
ncbi:MAG: serine protein kinase [Epulopiscium sp. Nele67-Bin001]|nr:MAG: serine protein kinase [Epulopiscium sp. Nuni2H_MBin001]OON91625.1 MAG: serine protein kinase [Epulopiscium sp. Nele67-Bin001]